MSTIVSSSDPFFICHPDVKVNPLADDVFESQDDKVSTTARRPSYVQAIPAFSQSIENPVTIDVWVSSNIVAHSMLLPRGL